MICYAVPKLPNTGPDRLKENLGHVLMAFSGAFASRLHAAVSLCERSKSWAAFTAFAILADEALSQNLDSEMADRALNDKLDELIRGMAYGEYLTVEQAWHEYYKIVALCSANPAVRAENFAREIEFQITKYDGRKKHAQRQLIRRVCLDFIRNDIAPFNRGLLKELDQHNASEAFFMR